MLFSSASVAKSHLFFLLVSYWLSSFSFLSPFRTTLGESNIPTHSSRRWVTCCALAMAPKRPSACPTSGLPCSAWLSGPPAMLCLLATPQLWFSLWTLHGGSIKKRYVAFSLISSASLFTKKNCVQANKPTFLHQSCEELQYLKEIESVLIFSDSNQDNFPRTCFICLELYLHVCAWHTAALAFLPKMAYTRHGATDVSFESWSQDN